MKYLSLLFVVFAAIFKAIADTLYHHYSVSIFSKLDPTYWNPTVSWQHVKFLPLTSFRPDAWHLSNSLMIVSFILAIVLYLGPLVKRRIWDFLIIGALFNLVFNLFYNQILT